MVGLIKVKVGKIGRIDRRRGISSKRATGNARIQGVVIRTSLGGQLAIYVVSRKEVKMTPDLIPGKEEKHLEDLDLDLGLGLDLMTREEKTIDILAH